MNRHRAKCKERDKPSGNNEHNISCTGNDSDTTTSRTIEYTWSQMGNTTSSNTNDTIYDKVLFWRKNLFLLPSVLCGERYVEEIFRLLNEWIQESQLSGISFKAVTLMPNLWLKKPSKNFWSYGTKVNLKNCTSKAKLFKQL